MVKPRPEKVNGAGGDARVKKPRADKRGEKRWAGQLEYPAAPEIPHFPQFAETSSNRVITGDGMEAEVWVSKRRLGKEAEENYDYAAATTKDPRGYIVSATGGGTSTGTTSTGFQYLSGEAERSPISKSSCGFRSTN